MEHDHQDSPVGSRRFRIWVQGRLDERFHEGLDGIEQADVPAGTMLSGALVDQSQLHSTLDLLRGLGIEVVRFEVDPPRPNGAGRTGHVPVPGEAMRRESTVGPEDHDT